MRVLSYDRLVLVVGPGAREDATYRRILQMESFSRDPVTAVTVNPFDFSDCFTTMNGLISSHNVPPHRVIVCIAGGTKLLTNAALLAAFQNGVEVYHVGDELLKLPVVLGLRVKDRFTSTEIRVVRALREGETLEDIRARLSELGMDRATVTKCLRNLVQAGVVRMDVVEGRVVVRWPQEARLLRDVLLA